MDLKQFFAEKNISLEEVGPIGELSDGFHTFNSLYEQRLYLFAALVNSFKSSAWKSHKHSDGEAPFGGGWFIVGIDTPEGSYTYHYEDKDWDLFHCREVEMAPEWDGHTDKDVRRVLSLASDTEEIDDWAKKEIELACKSERDGCENEDEAQYGVNCYESALRAYRSLEKDGHSGFSIQITKGILNRLIDGKCLTPIEEWPDIWNEVDFGEKNGTKQYQCTRMSSLFKKVDKDGPRKEKTMLKIEHTEVLGWEAAIRGMRNPLNSWAKSDSSSGCATRDTNVQVIEPVEGLTHGYFIGTNDADLMTRLRNAGTDHRKFMRMLTVYLDITAPLYWWKEFDTYKVGTVANSCSTMHNIADKEFTLEDFSTEHLFGRDDMWKYEDRVDVRLDNALAAVDIEGHVCFFTPEGYAQMTCNILNHYRKLYLETKDKKYWWQMIQLLPTSYNQKRTVMLNYEVLANIYKSRRNHKLDEWHTLCDWIEELPYSELITGKTD